MIEIYWREMSQISPLIECIQKQFNPHMVIELLQSGYQVTQQHDSSGAHIAQTIARFRMVQREFEQAKEWMNDKNQAKWGKRPACFLGSKVAKELLNFTNSDS